MTLGAGALNAPCYLLPGLFLKLCISWCVELKTITVPKGPCVQIKMLQAFRKMNTLMVGYLSFVELRNLVGFAVVCGVCFVLVLFFLLQ